MVSFIGSVIAGFFALIAALFGLGLGIGALMAIMLPLLLIALLPLLAVLLVVWILRRLGVLRGRFAGVVAVLAGLGLLAGVGYYGWTHSGFPLPRWLDDKRRLLESCNSRDGKSITIERDADGIHFSCHAGPARPTQPQDDANI